MFVVKALKGRQVFGDDLQQVVRVAEQALRFDDLRDLRQRRLKVGNGLAGDFAQGHEHDRRKAQAQLLGRQQGAIAQDHPRFLQRPHPSMARRKAQPHAFCEFGEGQAAIGVQLSENLAVNSIHVEEPSRLIAL